MPVPSQAWDPQKGRTEGCYLLWIPGVIEYELNAMIPPAERGVFSLRLILHGRRVCDARRPRCPDCVLNDFCPSSTTRASNKRLRAKGVRPSLPKPSAPRGSSG